MTMKNTIKQLMLVLLLFGLSGLLEAQEERLVRLAWLGDEYALRYAVEIEKTEDGSFQSHLRETTTSLYMELYLPLGEYRFRVITYDILGRPGEGSLWIHFEVRADIVEFFEEEIEEPPVEIEEEIPVEIELPVVAIIEPYIPAEEGRNRRYNSLGISVGTSYDPIFLLTLHGSLAPINNVFIQVSLDVGLVSRYQSQGVKQYYSLYPYVSFGYFWPFAARMSLFASAGAGYTISNYTFAHGDAAIGVFTVNLNAGINLFDFLNISYTLMTDFSAMNSKVSVGYVYRF